MLRAELIKQLLRPRTLVALAAIALVPVIAAVATASRAGHRNGTQSGLFGAAPFSALNHAAASLQFTAPLLLALVAALVGSALGAADAGWGTLRYLFVQPVSPRRLMTGKWAALTIFCALATAGVLLAAVLVGLPVFGWHAFDRLGASDLSAASALGRLALAGGYVTVCLVSIGSVALALGLVLNGPAEALAASVALVVVGDFLEGQRGLHGLAVVLPMHYWQWWTHLLDGAPTDLALGLAVQLATIGLSLVAAFAVLARRDPAA